MAQQVEQSPLRQLLENCFYRNEGETPDLPWLNLHKEVLIFVYDETKRAGRAASTLRDAQFVGTGFTLSKYVMYYKRLLGEEPKFTPYVFDPVEGEVAASIQGELYYATPSTIAELDQYQLNGDIVERRRVFVRGRDKRDPEKTTSGVCQPLMYVMNPSLRSGIREGGNMRLSNMYKLADNDYYYMFVDANKPQSQNN